MSAELEALAAVIRVDIAIRRIAGSGNPAAADLLLTLADQLEAVVIASDHLAKVCVAPGLSAACMTRLAIRRARALAPIVAPVPMKETPLP
ncbi:hypothetical protein [Falsiroseomonas selenitidurans]|uniref:Uncharacterized protein n=1 Tax=Falsiroseomonas selenitidurans TaxID=2716335 RepID=A0ABX1E8G0_9PROT|nr:hypothetical protein [Falsiroseomonas selenitidurans]NKC33474.1 hypothetical protein [Falsiroseomonas selenitidurans]